MFSFSWNRSWSRVALVGEADPSKNDLQSSDMFVSDDIESSFWISCIWSRLGLEVSLEKLGTNKRAVLRLS